MSQVHCPSHGSTSPAFVCKHIVQGMRDGVRVGFFCSDQDPDNPYPDAWCKECDQRLLQTGGEWEGEAEAQLGVQLMCGHCYMAARAFHTL